MSQDINASISAWLTPSALPHSVHLQEPHEAVFNWQKAWYPMMGIKDLDPSIPHAIMLLGKRLVLWRDARQIWRCLDDCCSHRQVILLGRS